MPARRSDLGGRVFERLTVLRHDGLHRYPNGKRASRWLCRCSCGNEVSVLQPSLMTGHTRSCGCLDSETTAARNHRHGLTESPEYRIWAGMIQRCTNPNATRYEFYGARGVTVCKRWLESFEAFLEDVGERPSPKHSLDREDNARGYEPGNVRWVTHDRQMNNTRRNRHITVDGVTKTVSEFARDVGIDPIALLKRLRRGWSPERAVKTPLMR